MAESRVCPFRKSDRETAFYMCYGEDCMAYRTVVSTILDDGTHKLEEGAWCALIERVGPIWGERP
jgi:hypothetical protein